MSPSPPYDEEELAELLAALPPAPDAWVRAAQDLAPREPSAAPRADVVDAQRQPREER
jgi:hypothetical protein